MPLARYFLYVGSVLLALLFMADAWLPKPAARVSAEVFQPVILIYSSRNWPERVVYNTSAPMTSPALSASQGPYIPAPERSTGESVKVLRQAFAKMRPSDTKRPQRIQSAKPAPTHVHRTVHKIPRSMLVFAQRQFGSRFVRMW